MDAVHRGQTAEHAGVPNFYAYDVHSSDVLLTRQIGDRGAFGDEWRYSVYLVVAFKLASQIVDLLHREVRAAAGETAETGQVGREAGCEDLVDLAQALGYTEPDRVVHSVAGTQG